MKTKSLDEILKKINKIRTLIYEKVPDCYIAFVDKHVLKGESPNIIFKTEKEKMDFYITLPIPLHNFAICIGYPEFSEDYAEVLNNWSNQINYIKAIDAVYSKYEAKILEKSPEELRALINIREI